MSQLADRLASRTLELVDIPSESLHEAVVRSRLRSLVPLPYVPVYEGDGSHPAPTSSSMPSVDFSYSSVCVEKRIISSSPWYG